MKNTIINLLILFIWPLIIIVGLLNELLEIFFPTRNEIPTRQPWER